jgi:hypothetical protein
MQLERTDGLLILTACRGLKVPKPILRVYGCNTCEARPCRFGLNGRNLILQAAQRAAKKRKRGHSASQKSECSEVATRVTSSDASNAAHGQQVTRLTITNSEGNARANERIDSQANSGTAQPLRKHGSAASSAAPRRGTTPSNAAPDALIDGLDPRDQPLVAYINRSSVPRIVRQVCPPIVTFPSATRACTLHCIATMCCPHCFGCDETSTCRFCTMFR